MKRYMKTSPKGYKVLSYLLGKNKMHRNIKGITKSDMNEIMDILRICTYTSRHLRVSYSKV